MSKYREGDELQDFQKANMRLGFGILVDADRDDIPASIWILAERIVRDLATMGQLKGSITATDSAVLQIANRLNEFRISCSFVGAPTSPEEEKP